MVVKLLRAREALGVEIADQLTSDIEAEVRFEALQALISAGRQLADNEVRAILVKPKASGGGLFGGFGAFDSEGEGFWDQFIGQRMAAMTNDDLERIAIDGSAFNRDAQFVFVERHFSKFGDTLRAAVDDHFKSEFYKDQEKLIRVYGDENELVQKSRNLEELLRKQFTRKGLDVICRNGDPQDLNRVRSILKSGFVDYSNADIEYLRKFGEWDDIPLIVATLDQPETGRSTLLGGSDDGKYRIAARAIYSLGRSRIEELLKLPAPGSLKVHLIVEVSESVFGELSDNSLLQLFNSENLDVRKAAVLKCIRALPKHRLSQLLNDYVSGDEFRYYNVIHWLDFGVSISRDRSRSAAGVLLKREWRS